MKRKQFTIILTLSLVTSVLFGQNTPFTFKNNRGEKSETFKPDIEAYSKFQDSIANFYLLDTLSEKDLKVFVYNKKIDYYSLLAETFEKLSKDKGKEIDKYYAFERQRLLDEMEKNPIDEIKLNRFTSSLEDLEKQMLDDKKIVTKLLNTSKEMDYKARNANKLIFIPVRNAVDAQLYYDYYSKDQKARYLKNSIICFNADGGKASIYNELYADYFGPLRFGVGALISNKETKLTDSSGVQNVDSTSLQIDAVQRLIGGGGNVVINVGYPFLGYNSKDQSLAFKLALAPKLSFDVPNLGTENDDYSVNCDFGFEGSIFYSGVLDILTFYGNVRIAKVFGNDLFYDYLNKDHSSFYFNQTSLGVALNSTFRISWSFYWGDNFVKDNFPSTISFSVIPN